MRIACIIMIILCSPLIAATQAKDTSILVEGNYITLADVVVNQKLDVASFIRRVKEDTTFYKAFKNLRVVQYTAINDIRMLDKKGRISASLNGRMRQLVRNKCRSMEIIERTVTGDFFNPDSSYNYYTASMYAQLFFTKGTVCNESNIIGDREISLAGLDGIERRKAQLKMLFFNPGKRIDGLPFISNKTEIFHPAVAKNYDMRIDFTEIGGRPSYVFSISAKKGQENQMVIKEMTTWFDMDNFDILARNYSLGYNAGVYDFDVKMRVRMRKAGNLLVPELITYNGNWKVMFKKRERGIFTATLFDFIP